MDFTECPETDCINPAEILHREVLESTHGPIEHTKVRCLAGHWFLLPTETLSASR